MNTALKIDTSKRYAFFSLTNKARCPEFAQRLVGVGVKMISAGGTCKTIAGAGIEVVDLADIVGGGSALGHKVLTLSREYAMMELADMLNPVEMKELFEQNLAFVDIVYCNLYDLPTAIAKAAEMPNRFAADALVVAATDIGGPNMLRAAAKGFRAVAIRDADMEQICTELEKDGEVSFDTRQNLRWHAEAEVTKYTGYSAMYHSRGKFNVICGEELCRFKGENGPQSPAILYTRKTNDPLSIDNFRLIGGADPSFNNWRDIGDRLLQVITHLAAGWKANYGHVPFIAIGSKHGNPCGAALGDNREEAVHNMVVGDARAIFGGSVITNFEIDGQLAQAMIDATQSQKAIFDVVIAPGFTADAVEALARKKGKCRLMVNPALAEAGAALLDTASRLVYVRGGYMIQPNYTFILNFNHPDMKVFGERNALIESDLLLAWAIGCTSNSNKITITRNFQLLGNGTGRQDRVGAAELAIKIAIDAGHATNVDMYGVATEAVRRIMESARKGGRRHNYAAIAKNAVDEALFASIYNRLKGAVAYSSSFFPFEDGPKALIDAGIKAIFSTSGSVNDAKVQRLCEENGVMLYQLPDTMARGFFGH